MSASIQAVSPGASSAKPKKLFYRINEVAKMTGLKAYVLRYWEGEFTELSPEKDSSDQRRYRDKDIQTVFAIKKLLYEDRFTIKGARPKLKHELKQLRAGANAPAASKPRKKSLRTMQKRRGPVAGRSVRESIKGLRNEVSDLLRMLGA